MSEYHSNPYPCPSDSASQPYAHGVYPYTPPMSTYPVNGGLQMAYPTGTQGSLTWVTDQVAIQSVTENHPHALQMGHSAYPPMLKGPIKKKNKQKKKRKRNLGNLNQTVRCELCDIYCNSIALYEMHLAGKRHFKTLQKKYASGAASSLPTSQSVVNDSPAVPTSSMDGNSIPGAPSGPLVEDLGRKKQKLLDGGATNNSVGLCSACNVLCNSEKTFATHCAGKRHTKQLKNIDSCIAVAEGSFTGKKLATEEPENGIVSEHDGGGDSGVAAGLVQGTKLVHAEATERSARLCATCNIVCNGEVAFAAHVAGKKHATQVRKASAGTENPAGDSEERGQKVEGSGQPSTTAIVCDVCKVVCNSDSVMKTHLAGKKHASMVKKLAGTSVPVSTTT